MFRWLERRYNEKQARKNRKSQTTTLPDFFANVPKKNDLSSSMENLRQSMQEINISLNPFNSDYPWPDISVNSGPIVCKDHDWKELQQYSGLDYIYKCGKCKMLSLRQKSSDNEPRKGA